MFRIMIARNGRYYVQKLLRYGWSRFSLFYWTRQQCRDFIDAQRRTPRVVEYY